MKKIESLSIIVIFLFISLIISPNIYANTNNSEIVKFTLEAYELNDGKQTIRLTQQETEKIEEIFISIRNQLNTAKSKDEIERIFMGAILELNKKDLLGDLSIEQAQRLVFGNYLNYKSIEKINKKGNVFENKNCFCLVAGCTSITAVMTPRSILIYILSNLNIFNEKIISSLNNLFFNSIEISTFFNPILFYDFVFIGGINNQPPFPHYVASDGWIYSIGLMGEKSWNGSFFGDIPLKPLHLRLSQWDVYPGIMGLTGIKFCSDSSSPKVFYLGSALSIKITY